MTNPFDALHKNRSKADRRAYDAMRYEGKLVDHTLQHLGLGKHKRVLYQSRRDTHGERELRFATFNHVFPTFPFLLGISHLNDKRVHQDPTCVEAARFKRFEKVSFVLAYERFCADVGHEADLRKLGLIVPRKGLPQGLIIHNDDSEAYWTEGLCWVYKASSGRKLYVQPYKFLLSGIHRSGRGWRPDDDPVQD